MSVPPSAIVTDLYQLTMAQGYLKSGMERMEACFDLFFRANPFGGGYTIFAGLDDALSFLESMRFPAEDIAYLKSLDLFDGEFLGALAGFRFEGDVFAPPEGSVVFPNEPVMRIVAPLHQCQIAETALLNIINFQSLIATKASRVCLAAGRDNVMEFGLRRAQGVDGGLTASRAAYIGGCCATSNVQAGKIYGIPVRGTHAHSWVTAFDNELAAFRKFAEIFPDNCVLLVDTYDTLKSGVPNAITVGLEMKSRGERLGGIRLDSGDLAFLSAESRKMLDAAGLEDVKIVASNELDEYIIHDMNAQGARIDIYGVGTRLVTGHGEPAMPGVYKLAAIRPDGGEWTMRLKLSETASKSTIPGLKQVWRMKNGGGTLMGDLLEIEGETPDFSRGVWGFHPAIDYQRKFYERVKSAQPLLAPVMRGGKITGERPSLSQIRARVQSELSTVHPTTQRLLNPHIYKVSLGPALAKATRELRGAAKYQ
ncbi:MAG: nicotinate phosphoribosyltransferase [Nitrospinae bacterium]|nr:nicotinate phosphoribosyltransferase [Nitrospinota bacterium]